MHHPVTSAAEGRGVARLLSYQVADHVRGGRLKIPLRSHKHAPLPVHVLTPEGRIRPQGRRLERPALGQRMATINRTCPRTDPPANRKGESYEW
jgi:hypothetical protein